MIEVKHLTKRYGNHTAVSDLSITIETGQIYGFLGPNGAGKTTTMNIMTGCLAATSGQVLIDGHDIYTDAAEAKRRIGYLPEQPPVYPDMTPYEYLRFVGEAKGLRRTELADQVAIVMDQTQITDMKDRLIRNLSKGYRQRVGIAQAILGSPDVIILDEPSVGLDPAQIIEIRDLIKTLGQTHTIILSSHILSEVSAVCDHIMILSKGKLVVSGTPEELSQMMTGSDVLSLTAKGEAQTVRALLEPLEGVERLEVADTDGQCTVRITPTQGTDLREAVFFAFCDARIPILDMHRQTASLEQVFLELTAQTSEEQTREQTYLYGSEFVDTTVPGEEEHWTPDMLQPLEPIQVPEMEETPEGGEDHAGDL